MDSIISEGAQPTIITNLCESFSPIFEPIYEDATKYLIESSRNLNIIAESMGIEMDKKIIGKDILVTEDARRVIIKEGYDTFVVNPEEYLSNEINSYMGKFNLNESSNKIIYDMNSNKIPLSEDELNKTIDLLDEATNPMQEARKLSNMAIFNFTSSLKKAKNDDSMFKDSICRDLSKGNEVCIQLFELGCQQLELGSAKEIDEFIDNKIIPDLKKLVELLKTKTEYNIRLHSSEDNFAILMCNKKINESNNEMLDEGLLDGTHQRKLDKIQVKQIKIKNKLNK